jgi:hypothetical protein
MPSRVGNASPLPPAAARAHVYVAVCAGEDIAKIGFSRDPLRRLQTLHSRWFEFFDVAAGFVVSADSVREARRIERRLIVAAVDHRAAAPLTASARAGGHTEWFRGANALLDAAADDLDAEGFAVARPLRPWLAVRMRERAGALYEWSQQALRAIDAGDRRAFIELRDALDALAAFGLDAAQFVDADVLQAWHELLRPGSGRGL